MFEEKLDLAIEMMRMIYTANFYQLKSSYEVASPLERVEFLYRCFNNQSDGLSIVLTSASDQGKLTDIVRWLLNEAISHKVTFCHQPMLGIAGFSNSNELLQIVLEYGFAVRNLCRGRTSKIIDANLQSLFDAQWDSMAEEAEIWTVATNTSTNSEALFSHGFDSLSSNASKQFDLPKPPLFRAAISVDLTLTRLLLDRGVDINIRDSRGRTVLMETVNLELVQFFLANGIDIDAQDREGLTALMHCAKVYRPWFSDVEIIELLLQHGARIDLKDNFGDTVLDLVKSKQKRPMKLLLEKHLAKLNQRLYAQEEEEEAAGEAAGDSPSLQQKHSVSR